MNVSTFSANLEGVCTKGIDSMYSITRVVEIAFNVCLNSPINVLIMLRNQEGIKHVIKDNGFWKARLERIVGTKLDFPLSNWYTACKYVEEGNARELLYSSDIHEVKLVLYLNRIGAVEADPVSYICGAKVNGYPLDYATINNDEEIVEALLLEGANPYTQYSWAISYSIDYGSEPYSILKMFLSIEDVDAYSKIQSTLRQLSLRNPNTSAFGLLLDDRRSNPSGIYIDEMYCYGHASNETIRTYLDCPRISRNYSISRLFYVTSLHDNPDLGEIALEYDRKNGIRIIDRRVYISTLAVSARRRHDKALIFLLAQFREEGFMLTSREYETITNESEQSSTVVILNNSKKIRSIRIRA